MKQIIELKHVGPKDLVRGLLEQLSARLEDKLAHFPADAVTLHVVFEENGRHKVYRTALTCHVPGHTAVAHEEGRNPGLSIRSAFAEVERQLEKQKAVIRHDYQRKRTRRLLDQGGVLEPPKRKSGRTNGAVPLPVEEE